MNQTDSVAKTWGLKSSSQIATAIAKKHGLKMEISPSDDARKEFRVQTAQMSDLEVLTKLADYLNWDFHIEGKTLHFHPYRFDARPIYEYTYYTDGTGDVVDFSADLNLKKPGKTGKVGASGKTGETGVSAVDGKGTGPKAGQFAVIAADRGAIYFPTTETDPNAIVIHARAQQAKVELSALKAKISLIGDPGLRSGVMVKVNGVGRAYSGNWYIKETRHVINPSGQVYVTECDLVRNALSTGKKKDKEGKKESGLGAKPVESKVTIWTGLGAIEN